MIFSQVHDWQGNDAVKQILVFVSQHRKNEFDVAFAKKVETEGIAYASDSAMGAIYKLRAVKNGEGRWVAVVRDGFDGSLIFEDNHLACATWQTAIAIAVNYSLVSANCENFEKLLHQF